MAQESSALSRYPVGPRNSKLEDTTRPKKKVLRTETGISSYWLSTEVEEDFLVPKDTERENIRSKQLPVSPMVDRWGRLRQPDGSSCDPLIFGPLHQK